jgi:uncharacterized protein YndB with AHSA1/START domain
VLLARRLNAPPERVFDAWLDQEKAKKWILGPSPADELTRIVIEPRVGGAFSLAVVRNGQEIDHVGSYVEIDRPRRLAFTWTAVLGRDASGVRPATPRNGTLVTLDFAPAGAGTELRLTHESVPEDVALRTEDAWSKIIQALANTLSG